MECRSHAWCVSRRPGDRVSEQANGRHLLYSSGTEGLPIVNLPRYAKLPAGVKPSSEIMRGGTPIAYHLPFWEHVSFDHELLGDMDDVSILTLLW